MPSEPPEAAGAIAGAALVERVRAILCLGEARPSAPDVELVAAEALPALQRRLLDHGRDMTGTLTAHFGEPLRLEVLRARLDGDVLWREVVLLAGARPVEVGAIRIELGAFAPAVRARIVAGEQPLGGILTAARVPLCCAARAFLRRASDRLVAERLALAGPALLFGRLARLATPDGRLLAEAVETLPPLDG